VGLQRRRLAWRRLGDAGIPPEPQLGLTVRDRDLRRELVLIDLEQGAGQSVGRHRRRAKARILESAGRRSRWVDYPIEVGILVANQRAVGIRGAIQARRQPGLPEDLVAAEKG